jgi:hypothetical protein
MVFTFISCKNANNKTTIEKNSAKKDTIVVHDTVYVNNENKVDWQVGFGLTNDPHVDSIWGKPVAYYLDDEACNSIAFEFYYGYIRPSDNGATDELLKLACTDNKKLRPFYRWCLNKTLIVSDGALAEHVGVPARNYAEKFPDEFFEYLDIENDNSKYDMWTDAIQYSGFFDYPEYSDIKKLVDEHYKRMSGNLKNKSPKNLKRVRKFANDCQSL